MTDKQQAVLSLVEEYWREYGVAPSLSELARRMETAKTTVHGHLLALAKKGFLVHTEGKGRTWRPMSVAREVRVERIPLVGRVAAGVPILAQENIERWIPFEDKREGEVLFGLHVRGDSMEGAGILDGDVVIVRQQQTAEPGEIVLALVDDQEATIKRLHQAGEVVVLEPENPSMEAFEIPGERVKIQGKVICVRRRLEEGARPTSIEEAET
jgi:repressor LexA